MSRTGGDRASLVALISNQQCVCPGAGSLDREIVQQVMAVWDQWSWFSGTGGPCQGHCGWVRLEMTSFY